MKARLERLREKFGTLELDAFFVSSPENRRYLSGFVGSAGYLVISREAAVLATDFRYTEQAGLQAPDFPHRPHQRRHGVAAGAVQGTGRTARRVRGGARDGRAALGHRERAEGGRGGEGREPGGDVAVHRPAAGRQGRGGAGAGDAGDGDRRPRLRGRVADHRGGRDRGVGGVADGVGDAGGGRGGAGLRHHRRVGAERREAAPPPDGPAHRRGRAGGDGLRRAVPGVQQRHDAHHLPGRTGRDVSASCTTRC